MGFFGQLAGAEINGVLCFKHELVKFFKISFKDAGLV